MCKNCTQYYGISGLFFRRRWSVGLYVGHERALCKNGRTDRAVLWDGERGGSRNCVLDGRVQWHQLTNTVEQLCAAAIVSACGHRRLGDAA